MGEKNGVKVKYYLFERSYAIFEMWSFFCQITREVKQIGQIIKFDQGVRSD